MTQQLKSKISRELTNTCSTEPKRLLVSIDEHYLRDSAGAVFSSQGTTPYSFWAQYLTIFDEVRVLARVHGDNPPANLAARADGERVRFLALPDFLSPVQLLKNYSRVTEVIRSALKDVHIVMLRGPGLLGGITRREAMRASVPYAIQVIGDPDEVFGPGRAGGKLRAAYRIFFTRELRQACEQACAVSYVTRSTLQRKYPAAKQATVACWSDVDLSDAVIDDQQLQSKLSSLSNVDRRLAIVGFVGSLQQPYKGADILLRALAICREHGLCVRGEIAGDGRLRSELVTLAEKLSLSSHVRFHGHIDNRHKIFEFLDEIDLFVMPSLTEGLPRALLEAMSRGCPSIGSDVGGIPELLPGEDLFRRGSPTLLAEKILQKLSNPSGLSRMAIRNRAFVGEYAPAITNQTRQRFYRELWLRAKPKRVQRIR